MDIDMTQLIELCIGKLITKKEVHLPHFSKFLEGSKDFNSMEMNNPTLDLYFTPRKILIK